MILRTTEKERSRESESKAERDEKEIEKSKQKMKQKKELKINKHLHIVPIKLNILFIPCKRYYRNTAKPKVFPKYSNKLWLCSYHILDK